jgi:hypothetical protein
MREQRLSDAEIGAIPEKKARSYFWWPRTDSVESARQAAKGGSVAFGLTALGLLMMLATAVFALHGIAVEDYVALFLGTALFVYLTWRTYKRPTILLNCIAFALVGLELGFRIIVMLAAIAANAALPSVVHVFWMPVLGTLAAVAGIRGSLAVRRFGASAPPAGASAAS